MTVSAALAAILLLGAEASADPVAEEQKRIRGSWTIASCHTDGILNPDAMKRVRYHFEDDSYKATLDADVFEQGTIRLDPAPAVKEFELAKQGEEKGALGIYEIDGDTLRICFDPSRLNRPKAFDAAGGNVYLVLKRELPRTKP